MFIYLYQRFNPKKEDKLNNNFICLDNNFHINNNENNSLANLYFFN